MLDESEVKHQHIWGVLKSWSDYTKAERSKTISALIAEMTMSGVNGKEFDELAAQSI